MDQKKTMMTQAFAKVNLTLEVLGRRPDGFHALRSVVWPIGLSDTLTFTPAQVFSTDTGYPDDLILKAARVLGDHRTASTPLQSYAIHVDKRIPAGGGLGGGSADAAAALLALNDLWRLGKTPEELAALGSQVGSDVPALILANHYRTPVLMEGRGEIVSRLSADRPKNAQSLSIILANPGIPCSTAAVYGRCRVRGDDGGIILGKMRAAWASGDAEAISAAMMNDLQAPALEVCPAIATALDALRTAGIRNVLMSGSGSTVFGFIPPTVRGEDLVRDLEAHGLLAWCAPSLSAPSR